MTKQLKDEILGEQNLNAEGHVVAAIKSLREAPKLSPQQLLAVNKLDVVLALLRGPQQSQSE